MCHKMLTSKISNGTHSSQQIDCTEGFNTVFVTIIIVHLLG